MYPPSYSTRRRSTTTLQEAQELGRAIQKVLGARRYQVWVESLGVAVIFNLDAFKAAAECKLGELKGREQ